MTTILLALLAAASTVAAGAVPLLRKEVSARALSLLVAFSAGVLLSVGLTEMLPESFDAAGRTAFLAAGVGFLLLYLIEKITLIHVCREQDCEVHDFGWLALIGIGFHSMVDGFAIAVSGEIDLALGVLVAVAVFIHRVPDGVSIAAVMMAAGFSRRRSFVVLVFIALLALVGAALGLLTGGIGVDHELILGVVLGFSAGIFIYVATNDLLPEAHRNYADYAVPALFVVGFAAFYSVALLLPHA